MKITSIEKIILSIIGFCTLALIICIPLTMKACSQLANEIDTKGLKGITEEIWEGSQSNDDQEIDKDTP